MNLHQGKKFWGDTGQFRDRNSPLETMKEKELSRSFFSAVTFQHEEACFTLRFTLLAGELGTVPVIQVKNLLLIPCG